MADLLGTALSVGNGLSSGSQSSSDMLIDAFRKTKQSGLDALKTKQSTLEYRKVYLSKFRTRLETLTAKSDTLLADNAAASFATKKVAVSDTSILTATADGGAATGISTVKVDRLASNDILVSGRKNLTDGYVFADSTKSITINGVSADVTFGEGETNETALAKIASAINNNSSFTVSASVVKDTSSTVRLTFTAKTTGADNQVNFTDGDILGDIGITSASLNPNSATRSLSTPTSAGYKLANFADLDSQIQVNGVQVTRATNSFNDVLSGVTFTLNKAQSAGESAVTLTTSVDTDKLANTIIQPFLDSFNDTIRFLKQDPSALRADPSLRAVYSKLRNLINDPVTTVGTGNPKYLTDIGIKIADDGTLSVGNKDTLQSFLESNPQKISDLFTTADGFASKAKKAISNLIGSDGFISTKSESLQGQITLVTNQTKNLQKRIDSQADSLRKEYEKLQKVYLKAQGQFNLLSGFTSSSSQ
jgi:flagellar hook-associated protein 2